MGELRVEGLQKSFPNRMGWNKNSLFHVCRNLSFVARDGEFVSVIGPSGCGKTTVLNMLAGLEEPTAGQISINDERVTGPGLDRGVVFQDFALFPWLTVSENIAFGLRSMGITRAEQSRRVKYYTELVGLSKFEDYYPNRLSGGMRQRVGLGRALAIEPALLLMDEPFSALDAQTREAMQNSLSDIWMRTKKTVLFVTHDIREAIFLSDRVLVLNGEPSEITLEMGIDLPRPRDRHHPEFQSQEAILERAIAGEFQKEPRSAPNR